MNYAQFRQQADVKRVLRDGAPACVLFASMHCCDMSSSQRGFREALF